MASDRTSTGQFAKGVSGNPEGRPKMPEKLAERIRNLSDAAVDTLEKRMSSTDERVSMEAAKVLLERAWGKPVTPTDLKVDGHDLAGAHLTALKYLGQGKPRKAVTGQPANGVATVLPADAKAH